MSAYNRIRGVYATEYRHTLTDILRTECGFEGYVQSDFWSCRSAASSLNAGMDHEMPDAKWLNETNVKAALRDTSLEIETVDRALYTQMFRFGQFERPYEPGEIDARAHGAIRYSEGLGVGYRWFQAQGIEPLFGFGLSYTTFDLSGVSVDSSDAGHAPVTETATVTNTGVVPGAEVVQVYLGVPVPGQPPKRLVGSRKVFVQPGESQRITITIDPVATNHPFSVWDHCTRSFVTKPGEYTVHVGDSADHTPHTTTAHRPMMPPRGGRAVRRRRRSRRSRAPSRPPPA